MFTPDSERALLSGARNRREVEVAASHAWNADLPTIEFIDDIGFLRQRAAPCRLRRASATPR